MLQKETQCVKSRVKTFEQEVDVQVFFILFKEHIFSFSSGLWKLQKILTCFPEDKKSTIYSVHPIQKVYIPDS